MILHFEKKYSRDSWFLVLESLFFRMPYMSGPRGLYFVENIIRFWYLFSFYLDFILYSSSVVHNLLKLKATLFWMPSIDDLSWQDCLLKNKCESVDLLYAAVISWCFTILIFRSRKQLELPSGLFLFKIVRKVFNFLQNNTVTPDSHRGIIQNAMFQKHLIPSHQHSIINRFNYNISI